MEVTFQADPHLSLVVTKQELQTKTSIFAINAEILLLAFMLSGKAIADILWNLHRQALRRRENNKKVYDGPTRDK